MNPKWETIGRVGVDAGIIMIGDPCYTLPDDASHRTTVAKNWGKFCKEIGNNLICAPLGDGIAVVVSSGYGDGEYPVQVKRKDGRIKEVRVKFF